MSESPALPGTGMSWSTRIRLSLMMFLQFMMFPVFYMTLAVYLPKVGVEGTWRALAMSSQGLGCLAAPLVGMIADRHFASQKVLFVLNVLGAALLVAVSQVTDPTLVVVLLIAQQLCYMPTWGLTSAIAMSHSPAEKFPQVRVFGSIGWVAAGLFSLVAAWLFKDQAGEALKIEGTNITFLCGAGTGLVAAIVALTLPNTPPPAKGQKASVVDALGLRSFTLMKIPSFAVFIIVSTLAMIPFTIYWVYCSVFLTDQGFQYITVTMGWGQLVEMFIMLSVPFALAKLGLKWTMVLGLVALVVRYLLFLAGDWTDMTWLYFGAILVHGIIFGYFFVGGQVYVDKVAPKELRAQAQGLLFLITFGVGLLVGTFFNEWLIKTNSTIIGPGETTTQWGPVWQVTAISSAVLMVAMALLFHYKEEKTPTEIEAAE